MNDYDRCRVSEEELPHDIEQRRGRCRISEEELSHDIEQMRDSELYSEAERVAERMIGNFDQIGDLISALAGADDATLRGLVKAISERHPSIVGLLPIIKAEFVKQVLDNQ